MRSIDSIMGEIRTEAAEIGLTEKLEERERDRAVRVERILAEHAGRADRIGPGRATRELAVALQRSEEGHDEATQALGRYRAFVRELVGEGGPLHVVWMGAATGFASTRLSDGSWRQRALALLDDQDGERARKALEGRTT